MAKGKMTMREKMIKQMFPTEAGITLGTMMILIILVAIIIHVTITDSSTALEDMNIRQTADVLEQTATHFKINTEGLHNSIVRFLSQATFDTTRSDGYSDASHVSYIDFDVPQSFYGTDSRHQYNVSLGISSVHFPGSSDPFVPTLAQGEWMNRTCHLDDFYKNIYDNNLETIQMYFGDDATGGFRRYPGNVSDTSYDPRLRGWYPCDQQMTDPYPDAITQRWMMTLCNLTYGVDGQYIGTTGTDITIDDLRDLIQDGNTLDSGKISIIRENGVVLATDEWEPTAQDENLFMYTDLIDPPISSEMWADIKTTELNGNSTYQLVYDDKEYIVQAYNNLVLGGNCFTIARNLKEDIHQPTAATVEEGQNISTIIYIVIICVGVPVTCIMFAVMIYESMRIIRPIDGLIEGQKIMMMTQGDPTAEKAVRVNHALGNGTVEGDVLIQEGNLMLDQFQEERCREEEDMTEENRWRQSVNLARLRVGPVQENYNPDDIPMALRVADTGEHGNVVTASIASVMVSEEKNDKSSAGYGQVNPFMTDPNYNPPMTEEEVHKEDGKWQ
jgi:competence protein ComGC